MAAHAGHGETDFCATRPSQDAGSRRGGGGRDGGAPRVRRSERGGPERRERARRPAATSWSRVREKGEGISAGDFVEKPPDFPAITSRSLAAMNCGLRVDLLISEGCFYKSVTGMCGGPLDRQPTVGIVLL